MNIIVCHSHMTKCGVREYGRQLDQALTKLGASVQICSYDNTSEGAALVKPGDVFLVHFEAGLVTPWYLNQYLNAARDRGAKIVLCCHWYEAEYMQREYTNHCDHMVLHREYPRDQMRTTVIPLGCPLYDVNRASRAELRASFGLPRDKIIVTTMGFLTRWKMFPAITRAMLDAIRSHPNVHLRVHTPWPFDEADAREEDPMIRGMIAGLSEASFSTEFLSEERALDLVRCSDLGFVFHGFHTHSVSAATKQYVSTRTPLVVTGSSHALDLYGGIIRVPTFDPPTFARAVVDLTADRPRLAQLRHDMEGEYERLNMTATARRYMQLFAKLLDQPHQSATVNP